MASVTGVCSKKILFHVKPAQHYFGKNIIIHVKHGMATERFFKTNFKKLDMSYINSDKSAVYSCMCFSHKEHS